MTWLGANRDVRLLQEALDAKDRKIAHLQAALEKIANPRHDAERWESAGYLRDIARKALEEALQK
jgi:hypothetical protein